MDTVQQDSTSVEFCVIVMIMKMYKNKKKKSKPKSMQLTKPIEKKSKKISTRDKDAELKDDAKLMQLIEPFDIRIKRNPQIENMNG